jgi:hypothetical protein
MAASSAQSKEPAQIEGEALELDLELEKMYMGTLPGLEQDGNQGSESCPHQEQNTLEKQMVGVGCTSTVP